jgi:UDP-N-acetylmuramyl pentapeptide phosphotransferase/UDP-N-acetylglucosamine-1-phosphate transferase
MSVTGSPLPSARLRVLTATVGGLAFILAYTVAAVTVADLVPLRHWALQASYWCVAGVLWVFPIWALMLFAAGHGRRSDAPRARL